MAEHLIPIKIKITRGQVGGRVQNVYPDFNALDPSVRGNMDWAHFIDHRGFAMHYDQQSPFGEGDVENPDPDVQYCATLVPEAFAMAAVAAFPALVQLLTEDDWEHFYNNRAHADEPDEHIDETHLKALLLRKDLEDKGLLPAPSQAEITRRTKMLNPLDDTPGIRRNHRKTWSHIKEKRQVNIHPNFKKRK